MNGLQRFVLSVDETFLYCQVVGKTVPCQTVLRTVMDMRFGKCYQLEADVSQRSGGIGIIFIINLNSKYRSENYEPHIMEGLAIKVEEYRDPGGHRGRGRTQHKGDSQPEQ